MISESFRKSKVNLPRPDFFLTFLFFSTLFVSLTSNAGDCSSHMSPWIQELIGFLTWGSSSGWFGLACPPHCTASPGYLTAFILSGFCLGFLTASVLGIWLAFRPFFPPWISPAAPQASHPLSSLHPRLSAYLHERPLRHQHSD